MGSTKDEYFQESGCACRGVADDPDRAFKASNAEMQDKKSSLF
jgi:hypothetical protein